jgi:hypothetical protein
MKKAESRDPALFINLVARGGIEPPTRGSSIFDPTILLAS